MSYFNKLSDKKLITNYPSFLKDNIHYEVMMGSIAYGVNTDMSDVDIYGFCIPPKTVLFPYSYGNIYGFGKKPKNFEQFQKHHILDKSNNQEYDLVIYNIVKFFQLCMENNPNMMDSLFVPERCVLHSTSIGNHVRENRKLFLSKKSWHTFKGYAFSQLHKIKTKKPKKESKRYDSYVKYGYDVKFAYHVVRLMDECQMILEEHDLDLTRSRNHLKAIRNGEWSLNNIYDYFDTKIISLESLYNKSDLRYSCDEEDIKNLLMECLEMHYGCLDAVYTNENSINKYIIEAYNNLEKAMAKINK